MNSPTIELTDELIRRRSVTPADDGCLEIIGARLTDCGFTVEYLPFGDVKNLWAMRGSGRPVFAFAGHTDVVPPGDPDEWSSDPFEPAVRDDHLFGRGAADMKSSLAAMVTATERFVATTPEHEGTIAFLLTSDEEGIAVDGTVRVIDALIARGQPIDYCLVGEPSSSAELGDVIRNGRRGSLNGRLTVHGVQGHVAYPDKADNPIHRFAGAMQELCATQWDNGNDHYPPTSFQISNINAGTGAENVVPGALVVQFNFRFSTESTPESLTQRVLDILEKRGVNFDIEWRLSGNAFLTPGGILLDAVHDAIAATLNVETQASTGGGTSDGRFIAPIGAEVVEFGPVNATIHKVNESVLLADIDRLSAAYEDILVRVMSSKS